MVPSRLGETSVRCEKCPKVLLHLGDAFFVSENRGGGTADGSEIR